GRSLSSDTRGPRLFIRRAGSRRFGVLMDTSRWLIRPLRRVASSPTESFSVGCTAGSPGGGWFLFHSRTIASRWSIVPKTWRTSSIFWSSIAQRKDGNTWRFVLERAAQFLQGG